MMIYDYEVTLLWTSSTVYLEMQYYVSEGSSASIFRKGKHLIWRSLKKKLFSGIGTLFCMPGLAQSSGKREAPSLMDPLESAIISHWGAITLTALCQLKTDAQTASKTQYYIQSQRMDDAQRKITSLTFNIVLTLCDMRTISFHSQLLHNCTQWLHHTQLTIQQATYSVSLQPLQRTILYLPCRYLISSNTFYK